jgi:methyl-accepting chemotaxis protein
MLRHFKITHRLVVAIVAAATLVFGASFLISHQRTGQLVGELEEVALAEEFSAIQAEIDAESLRAEAMAAVVASIPQVQQAFAGGDRAALEAYFASGFDGLKSAFGVRQFQFHRPPATSYLRIHKLEKHGDDLSSFRHTVTKANQDRSKVHGLEVGVAGLGIRGIVPVSHAGRHVGTVEFGLSLGQDFVDRITALHGIDLQIHLLRDGALRPFASSTDAALLSTEQLADVDGERPLFLRTELADTPHALYAAALRDFSGKQIGVVVLARDRSAYAAQVASIGNQALVMLAVSVLLLMGLAWLIARDVTLPLRQTTASMEAIASGTGNLDSRLDDTGNDEIAALARAYNAFVEKIGQTIHAVVDTTHELASVADRYAHLSADTHVGTQRQREQVEQVATAMTEMSATVHDVARNTVETADAAASVDEQSNNGQQVVRSASESIDQLAAEVARAVERINAVEQDSERIGSVLDVIRGIADQTNLLALNAAIEAARAGEQGRGFAVVADEVRTLAQRTQDSTREIQDMIESLQQGVHATVQVLAESQRKAAGSVDKAEQAYQSLQAITASIDRITTMSAQIATAAEEQSSVAEDINRNILEITTVADRTASDAQSSVEQTHHLTSAVEGLVALMGQFRTGDRRAG